MNPSPVTAERVRGFIIRRYSSQLEGKGVSLANVPDDYDFLLQGVVDSFGVLELVGELEKEVGFELDMSGLDAEKITVLGPLSRYVAEQAVSRQSLGSP
jgi:acyl carrier protein